MPTLGGGTGSRRSARPRQPRRERERGRDAGCGRAGRSVRLAARYPGSGASIPPVTGQSMREVALTATGDVVVLGYDLNGTGVVEVRDALADSTRGVGSFAGPVTAVAAVDGQVAWGVAADGLGNVLVPYAIDSLFAVLPVQAPVVALAFAGKGQDGYVAAATATAVYVYNTSSFAGPAVAARRRVRPAERRGNDPRSVVRGRRPNEARGPRLGPIRVELQPTRRTRHGGRQHSTDRNRPRAAPHR